MAQQHIYTSASKLLDAGRSGFGTVARSKSLSPLLVSAIERVSQFANIRGTDRTRVIFVHRRIIAANNRVHIISRIADAGADYTGRTNHIAHHLIVTQEEMTRAAAQGITPADVLMQFPWLQRWDGAARFFGPEEDVSLTQLIQPRGTHSSRATWARLTGNPSHARLLCWEGAPRNGVLIVPRGVDPLGILAEALAEFGTQSWTRTFTTSLETTDEMSDLDWVISSPDNFYEIEGRCGARARLDLTQPQSLPLPPEPVKAVEAPAAQLPAINPQPAVTPAVQPVTVNAPRIEPVTLYQGRGTGTAVRSPLPVAKVKKKHIMIFGIGAAAALLFAAAAIFWFVANNASTANSSNVTKSIVPHEKDKEDSKKKLVEKGLSVEMANTFVITAGKDPQGLADYACDLLEFFKKEKPDIKSIRKDIPGGYKDIISIKWLSDLKKARDELDIDNENGYGFNSSLEIYKLIKNSAKVTEWKILSENSVDEFCSPLIQKELVNQFGAGDWNYDKDKIKLIQDFAEKNLNDKNNYAYLELKKFIRQNFEIFIDSPLKEIFFIKGTYYNIDDVTALKNATACWNDPNKKIDELIINNQGKGFIPEKFEDLLDKHRNKNNGANPSETDNSPPTETQPVAQKEPVGPNMKDIKDKEIIIVSAGTIKTGVEVELLKKLFTSDTTEFPRDLEILVNGENIRDKLTPINKVFADHYNTPKYKISLTGIISITNGCETISISYKNEKLIFQTYVVVEGDSKEPIFRDLKLAFHDPENNSVVITGELVKWIESIKPSDIKVRVEPKGKYQNGKVTIKTEKPKINNQPNINISENRSELIKSALIEYIEISAKLKKANLGSKDYDIQTANLAEANKNLLGKIMIGIGESTLLEAYPDLGNEIHKDNLEQAIKEVRETTGISVAHEKYKSQSDFKDVHKKDDVKAYEVHKKKIDRDNINNVLIVYGEHYVQNNDILKRFGQIENGKNGFKIANLEVIQKLVTKLTQKQDKTVNTTTQVNPSDIITAITVSTNNGRLLFKAVK